MDDRRIGWVSAWLGAAVGAGLTGTGAFGDWTSLILVGSCTVIALLGFLALRWKRVAFTFFHL